MSTADLARMEDLLNSESLCHLGLHADGVTCVVPINHTYVGGRLLMHCALEGAKLEAIRTQPKVCVEVSRQDADPTPHAGDRCSAGFSSVMCWGTARVVEDPEERIGILNAFQDRYQTPSRTRPTIERPQALACGAIEVRIERMTGRFFGDGQDIRTEWRFPEA